MAVTTEISEKQKTIDIIMERAVATATDYGFLDTASKIRENNRNLGSAFYLLAIKDQAKDFFESVFSPRYGNVPLAAISDDLIEAITSIDDAKIRGIIAYYAGDSISGFFGEGTVTKVLGVLKREDEFLEKRLEAISRMQSKMNNSVYTSSSLVHLALTIPNDAVEPFQSLISTQQEANLRNH